MSRSNRTFLIVNFESSPLACMPHHAGVAVRALAEAVLAFSCLFPMALPFARIYVNKSLPSLPAVQSPIIVRTFHS